ncbi:MAG: hypothetical protein JSV94_05260 [Methanobacteriota archaeon]|nr:MAG: hypothetical protein JSV94_05260 [Euryarchaeota archaeon]
MAGIIAVIILLGSSVLASAAMGGQTDDSTNDNRRKWTIAMYWASDNNLDEYTEYFIGLWIDHLLNREDVALCVFIDRLYKPANISTLTEEGWVERMSFDEINSSSPDTLSYFLDYSLTEPSLAADNFMLMVQNHGNGYLGLCSDEGLPDSDLPKIWMSIDGLGAGIRDGLAKSGKTINVISMDACTLGIVEVAYELRGTADYLVSSQMGVPFDGQNYIALLEDLSNDPGIAPLDLACKLVDDYGEWYSAPLHTYPTLYPYMQDFGSLSVVDLNNLEPLIDAFCDFREAVIPKDTTLGKPIRDAYIYADASLWMNTMGAWYYPDIIVMFRTLGDNLRESHPYVAECCDEIVFAAEDAIVYNWASWRFKGIATGLGVYVCPSIGGFEAYWDSFERAYDNVDLDFVEDSGWDLVLKEYSYTTKMFGNPPVSKTRAR